MTGKTTMAPGHWPRIAEAAIPDDAVGIAWDPGRRAIAGAVGGVPVTITAEQVLAFAAGEGLTPTEAATVIVAARLQPFIAGE